MDLTLNSDQELLLGEVSSFLQEQMPVQRLHRRADDLEDLKALASMGWVGITLSESAGGLGFTTVDEVLVFRELGRVIGPVSTFAAAIATHLCDGELRERLMAGETTVAVAHATTPVTTEAGAASGLVRLFSNASPDLAILLTPDAAWLLDVSQLTGDPLPCLDPSVEMRACSLANTRMIATRKDNIPYQRALTLLSAFNVGLAEAIRDLTAEYAKVRQTFGRPIGAYQAVRHPIAEMAARCEQAKTQLFFSALVMDSNRNDVALQVGATRVLAQQAATLNADSGIQLHGAIGVTDEYDAHFFLKRAALHATWFGGIKSALEDLLARPLLGFGR